MQDVILRDENLLDNAYGCHGLRGVALTCFVLMFAPYSICTRFATALSYRQSGQCKNTQPQTRDARARLGILDDLHCRAFHDAVSKSATANRPIVTSSSALSYSFHHTISICCDSRDSEPEPYTVPSS